jgi:hypothetical protein
LFLLGVRRVSLDGKNGATYIGGKRAEQEGVYRKTQDGGEGE